MEEPPVQSQPVQSPVALDEPRPVQRALAVWCVFGAASAGAIWGLSATARAPDAQKGQPSIRIAADAAQPALGTRSPLGGAAAGSITPRFADLDTARWRGIVIHHSGTPGGDLASLERRHVQDGLTGLGYHFVIGNGQGLDDGQVAVGYRWDRQLAGAAYYNEHTVAICLIGNGERRPFTERQVHELIALVRQLQAALGIPASEVHLHSALSGVASPGQYFPVARVMDQILP
jgi:hypothetical protein